MSTHVAFLAAAVLVSLPNLIHAQDYVVWSTVILTRTGERTPVALDPSTLTTTGSNQLYEAGSFFRQRYVSTVADSFGIHSAPLVGLNPDFIDNTQIYATALDSEWNIASAQAFLQGFYPPYSPNSRNGSMPSQNPVAYLENGSYVDAPLHGYQYAQIQTFSSSDWYQPLLAGNSDCLAWNSATDALAQNMDYQSTMTGSTGLYQTVGKSILEGMIDEKYWTYENAYAIYDYVSYEYAHNASVKQSLDLSRNGATNTSYLDTLRLLADHQQYTQLGDLTAVSSQAYKGNLGNSVKGSISTIAGNMLAANIMFQFETALTLAIENRPFPKLNLMFADFQPFVSFFALAGLPSISPEFTGLPDFGSSIAFELFSYANTTSPNTMPDTDDMYVRFVFRNGTTSNLQSYSVFGNGRDHPDMSWQEFSRGMSKLALDDDPETIIGEWCLSCGANKPYCAYYNISDAGADVQASAHPVSPAAPKISPAIGGVIGAVIALAIASLLLACTMLFGGVRFRRVERRQQHDLGGFKNRQKLASDQDLTIPKGGAVVTTEETASPVSPLGHERVGSWELKQREASAQQQQQMDVAGGGGHGAYDARNASLDEERIEHLRDPVKPREGV